jgi:glycosyltransferase involved in cell wall biosynthesis
MRLVIATPLYPPEPGGPATYAKILEDEFPSRGVEVRVVKFSEVRKLPKLVRHIAYYFKLRQALKDADLLLALDPVSVGFPAMQAAKHAKKRFFVKVVGDYAWEQGTQRFSIASSLDEFAKTEDAMLPYSVRILRKIERAVANAAEGVIVPSEYLKGIVGAWGIPEKKIQVAYNAVPLGTPGEVPEAVARLPRPLIASVGRLVPWKGMDGLIEAVGELRGRGIQASLAIVGEGPEAEPLLAHATTTLTDGFAFTGALSHPDTLAVMRHADAFVLNTSYEGLSHTLIEAMLLGKPIVTTAAGGNRELTTDGEDALWADPEDPKTLAECLARLIGDEALRSGLGARAKERVARSFSVEGMVERTKSILFP